MTELKSLHSPDVGDLKSYVPEDEDCFGFLLTAMIGAPGEKGEEAFDIMVCSPMWILRNRKPSDILVGRHYLIMQEYNFERLVSFIQKFCRSCSGNTWAEIANKLSRLGRWEFEDYQNEIPTSR